MTQGLLETLTQRLSSLDLTAFSSLRVLVAGDFMLDEYLWGRVERINPEAPVPVVEVRRETRTLGGAGNVVNNLAALGARVEVLGLVGEDHPGQLLRQELARLGVSDEGLFVDPQRRTSRKTRVMAGSQQVVRIDRETRSPVSAQVAASAREYLEARIPALDALVLSDYGKGALTPSFLQELIGHARNRGLPVVVDPKGADYSRYAGATVITPNRKEAQQAVGRNLENWEDLAAAGRDLRRRLSLDFLLITLGAEGMALFDREESVVHLPARAREVFDVSGAGDTVAAVMALALAQWQDPLLAAALANIAAGVVVGKVGAAPIFRSELEQELGRQGARLEEKIVGLEELSLRISHLQAQGKKVVFTNGCFDLLHGGHIKFLEDSRNLGDALVVAVDTDESVRRLKGPGRPIIGASQRLRILAALEAVDWVTLFESDQLPEILTRLKPDILTKGSNYPEDAVAGRETVQAYGGEVRLVPVTEAVSVSGLINRIRGEG
ncbi:MAG: D-glycero-beta-D-manno-heptose-7-phosphate kinase [Deltaproteobacteria bacterium]|nr:D-glycero-beta-D-manno-heptose-7-phosphate kinase [Deltaproteobacteria bacterium]